MPAASVFSSIVCVNEPDSLIAATPSGARLDYVAGFEFAAASAGVPFGRHVTSSGDVHFPPLDSATFGAANAAPWIGPLIISELQYNPAPGESEFIEIHNASDAAVPLAGVSVGGVGYVFDAAAPALAPGEVALLVEFEPAAFRERYSPPPATGVFGPYAGRLDNGGESVELRLPEAAQDPGDPALLVAVETVRFLDSAPWPPEADGDGLSLQRRLPPGYGNDAASWTLSEQIGGTPGVTGDPPADWREAFFTVDELANPDISGPNADADFDGIGNLAEYLMGTDLRDKASRPLLQGAMVEDGGGSYLELRHSMRNGVTEFLIDYQMADDLSDWQTADPFMEVVSTIDQGDGTSVVTVRSTVSVGDLGVDARFVRLQFMPDHD